MKIAFNIVRILMGLLFAFSGSVVLFKLFPQPELKDGAKAFMDGMMAAGYFLPFLALTELFCGLALVSGWFVPLATVVIFPVTLNILLYHLFMDPKGLPVAMVLVAANLFLAFACRKNYAGLVAVKRYTGG